MKIHRRDLLLGAAAAGLCTTAGARTLPRATEGPLSPSLPEPAETLDLWPDGVPGMPATPPVEQVVQRSTNPAMSDRFVTGIRQPRLVVFRPQTANGAGILLAPGGGYQRVVVDKEGYETAHWLAARGYTVFVLFYRLPGDGWAAGPDVALSDAQRAMRTIRHRAQTWAVDPQRVAVMGFSAGGHLCADLATRFDANTYAPVDGADTLSARPMLAAPVYPVISMSRPVAHEGSRALLIGEDAGADLERAHSPQHNVPTDAPPVFLVHAEDDESVVVENTLEFRAALREQGIPVEMHLFAKGGHGFGLRYTLGKPVAAWPGLFAAWAESEGLV